MLADTLRQLKEQENQDITKADNLMYPITTTQDVRGEKTKLKLKNDNYDPATAEIRTEALSMSQSRKQGTNEMNDFLLQNIANDEASCDIDILLKHVDICTDEELIFNGLNPSEIRAKMKMLKEAQSVGHNTNRYALPAPSIRMPGHRVILEGASSFFSALVKKVFVKGKRRSSIGATEPTIIELSEAARGNEETFELLHKSSRLIPLRRPHEAARTLVTVAVHSVEGARLMIKYVYGHEIEVATLPPSLLCAVLVEARRTGLLSLTMRCLQAGARRMNISEIIEFSSALQGVSQLSEVLEECGNLLASHAHDILKSGLILRLNFDALKSFLSSPLVMRPEADLLFATKLWLLRHADTPTEMKQELYKEIRFDALSPAQMVAGRSADTEPFLLDAAIARLQASEGEGSAGIVPPNPPNVANREMEFLMALEAVSKRPLMRARRARPWAPNGAFVVDYQGGRFPVVMSKRALGAAEIAVRRDMIISRMSQETGGPRDAARVGSQIEDTIDGRAFEETEERRATGDERDAWGDFYIDGGELREESTHDHAAGVDSEENEYLMGVGGRGERAVLQQGSLAFNDASFKQKLLLAQQRGAKAYMSGDDESFKKNEDEFDRFEERDIDSDNEDEMEDLKNTVRSDNMQQQRQHTTYFPKVSPVSMLHPPARARLQPKGYTAAPTAPLPSFFGSAPADAVQELAWRTTAAGSVRDSMLSIKPPGYSASKADGWAFVMGDPRVVSLSTWSWTVCTAYKGHFRFGVASCLGVKELKSSSDRGWFFDTERQQFATCNLSSSDPYVTSNEVYMPRTDGLTWNGAVEKGDAITLSIMVTRASFDLYVTINAKHMKAQTVFVHGLSDDSSSISVRPMTNRVFLKLRPLWFMKHEGDTFSMGSFV